MDGHDAAGQVTKTHLLEAGVLHHLGQLFLRRMLADALSQVTVTFLVTGYQLSEPGQDTERPGIINRLERLLPDF